jgi:hypothetical protein
MRGKGLIIKQQLFPESYSKVNNLLTGLKIPQIYYITLKGLKIFNAGCNPALKYETVRFLACIRQMADHDKKILW